MSHAQLVAGPLAIGHRHHHHVHQNCGAWDGGWHHHHATTHAVPGRFYHDPYAPYPPPPLHQHHHHQPGAAVMMDEPVPMSFRQPRLIGDEVDDVTDAQQQPQHGGDASCPCRGFSSSLLLAATARLRCLAIAHGLPDPFAAYTVPTDPHTVYRPVAVPLLMTCWCGGGGGGGSSAIAKEEKEEADRGRRRVRSVACQKNAARATAVLLRPPPPPPPPAAAVAVHNKDGGKGPPRLRPPPPPPPLPTAAAVAVAVAQEEGGRRDDDGHVAASRAAVGDDEEGGSRDDDDGQEGPRSAAPAATKTKGGGDQADGGGGERGARAPTAAVTTTAGQPDEEERPAAPVVDGSGKGGGGGGGVDGKADGGSDGPRREDDDAEWPPLPCSVVPSAPRSACWFVAPPSASSPSSAPTAAAPPPPHPIAARAQPPKRQQEDKRRTAVVAKPNQQQQQAAPPPCPLPPGHIVVAAASVPPEVRCRGGGVRRARKQPHEPTTTGRRAVARAPPPVDNADGVNEEEDGGQRRAATAADQGDASGRGRGGGTTETDRRKQTGNDDAIAAAMGKTEKTDEAKEEAATGDDDDTATTRPKKQQKKRQQQQQATGSAADALRRAATRVRVNVSRRERQKELCHRAQLQRIALADKHRTTTVAAVQPPPPPPAGRGPGDDDDDAGGPAATMAAATTHPRAHDDDRRCHVTTTVRLDGDGQGTTAVSATAVASGPGLMANKRRRHNNNVTGGLAGAVEFATAVVADVARGLVAAVCGRGGGDAGTVEATGADGGDPPPPPAADEPPAVAAADLDTAGAGAPAERRTLPVLLPQSTLVALLSGNGLEQELAENEARRAAARKGGDKGSSVVAFHVASSLLLLALARRGRLRCVANDRERARVLAAVGAAKLVEAAVDDASAAEMVVSTDTTIALAKGHFPGPEGEPLVGPFVQAVLDIARRFPRAVMLEAMRPDGPFLAAVATAVRGDGDGTGSGIIDPRVANAVPVCVAASLSMHMYRSAGLLALQRPGVATLAACVVATNNNNTDEEADGGGADDDEQPQGGRSVAAERLHELAAADASLRCFRAKLGLMGLPLGLDETPPSLGRHRWVQEADALCCLTTVAVARQHSARALRLTVRWLRVAQALVGPLALATGPCSSHTPVALPPLNLGHAGMDLIRCAMQAGSRRTACGFVHAIALACVALRMLNAPDTVPGVPQRFVHAVHVLASEYVGPARNILLAHLAPVGNRDGRPLPRTTAGQLDDQGWMPMDVCPTGAAAVPLTDLVGWSDEPDSVAVWRRTAALLGAALIGAAPSQPTDLFAVSSCSARVAAVSAFSSSLAPPS